ncbi:MAG: gamma carbonic anhydrase family protein [Firmicutes bacterium]|nr:gamma carbonic anhydrase family protein [Bacillota bacterium]MBR0105329.1 gamma carbonic anhydrase family protein [Bacillota bacterium]
MIKKAKNFYPDIDESVFIAENASIVGNVKIGKNSGIWYGAVIRSEYDTSPITIGENTNIQDNCIVHVAKDMPVVIGNNVSVGHGAIVHSAQIGDGSLIGMGAILLNNVKIGKNCLVAAGALVREGMEVPDDMIVVGSPAKIVGPISEKLSKYAAYAAEVYVEHAEQAKKDME